MSFSTRYAQSMKLISDVCRRINLEALVWIVGLLFLALTYPDSGSHSSLCVFKNMGFKYCPGCGIGHSISYFLHGDVARSLQTHPLGIFATVVLVSRIFSLLKDALVKNAGAIIKSK
jgi:hypothetical protein